MLRSLDFMIVGVQKSGTTALASFLNEHPDIAIANGKEVHLFDSPDYSPVWASEQINTIYSTHFKGRQNVTFMGEATPIYTYFQDIPAQLAAYNPRLKLIVLLRNPVDRAISQYWMERGRGDETLPLLVALLVEPFRLLIDALHRKKRNQGSHSRTHSYISRGHYTSQLNNLFQHFPVNQVLVVDNESLLSDHVNTLEAIFNFLGAPRAQIPAQKKVFTGDYSDKSLGVINRCLTLYFWLERKRLQRLLPRLNKVGCWRWLGE